MMRRPLLQLRALTAPVPPYCSGQNNCKVQSAAELAVVVAGIACPHLKHVDGIVEVCKPAFTSEVEVALFSLIQEYVPLTLINSHVDADLSEILLHDLSNTDVACTVVGQVCDVQRSICGKLAVFNRSASATINPLSIT